MTRRIAFLLAGIAMAFFVLTMGTAWATIVVMGAYTSAPERKATEMCRVNGGNHIMQLAELPSEMLGWRCYNFVKPDQNPTWIGPDILAREYLAYEKKTGWEVWEETS